MIKKTAIRGIRKAAHIVTRATTKAAQFSGRVENKASRIISGTDNSFGAVTSVPFEKLYFADTPHITPLHPSLPIKGRKPAVVLLIPSLQKSSFFGGTSTAIIAASRIAEKKGYDLRIVETLKHDSFIDIKAFLKKSGIPFSGQAKQIDTSGRRYNVYGYMDIHPDDIHMASAWWDAYILDQLPLTRKYIYLIQDFEPIFYANSDKYALAESTYNSDKYVALCNTKLMYDFMLNRNYNHIGGGAFFEPAVAYKAAKAPARTGKRRLFVYGRPNVERNLFFTGLAAIDHCFQNKYLDSKEWEVVMAGQDKVPDIDLSSGVKVKNLGKMEFDDYKRFISTIDLAVSLMMAPHPNYPTLEFASAGAAVVTTRYDIKQDLSNYSKNIVMADITAESISGAIRQAASIDDKTLAKNTTKNAIPSDWIATLDKPIDKVIKQL